MPSTIQKFWFIQDGVLKHYKFLIKHEEKKSSRYNNNKNGGTNDNQ